MATFYDYFNEQKYADAVKNVSNSYISLNEKTFSQDSPFESSEDFVLLRVFLSPLSCSLSISLKLLYRILQYLPLRALCQYGCTVPLIQERTMFMNELF